MPRAEPGPLLDELNRWAALRGTDIADSGEIGARIATLLEQLHSCGATVVEREGRFVLEGTEVERLLAELNHWAGLADPTIADTGEIGARIGALITELRGLGARLELRDGRYHLIGDDAPGSLR
ncbi:hypothetical protein ACW5EG_06425 [Luteimonas sp. A611]